MRIEELRPAVGSNRKNKRVGRGSGSGHGKTSCRGHKGQKSRSGGSIKPGFEGGQMPLQRRLPKRGFKNINSIQYVVINVSDIEKLGMDTISPVTLVEGGVIKNLRDGIKILGNGEIKKSVKVLAHAISAAAKQKIESAGGSVEVL